MVDAPDSKSGPERGVGSSPTARTKHTRLLVEIEFEIRLRDWSFGCQKIKEFGNAVIYIDIGPFHFIAYLDT